MASMSVAKRLGLGFGALIVLMIIISMLGIGSIRTINSNLDTIIHDKFPKTVWANSMIIGINVTARAMRNALLETAPHKIKTELTRIDDQKDIIDLNLTKLEETVKSPAGLAALKEVQDAHRVYINAEEEFIKLLKADRKDDAKEYLLTRIRSEQGAYLDAVTKLIDHQSESMNQTGEEASKSVRNALIGIVVLLILAVIASIVIASIIVRKLLKQLGGEPSYAAETVNRIAGGDLIVNLEIKPGDTSSLLYSLKTMQDSLSNLIRDIQASTDTINTASKEIASGNSDLSQRTEEQASSLEETASSMEELTSTVKQNTENAKQANQLAISASDVAGKGGEVVSKVVTTMDSINESSRKIVDIISVIDGIAFQTNILALNAAVEAARAGEQGRGFAVVAGEVRNLAQRSAAAAKEIKTLIGDSVEKVEGGSKLVAQAGQTMEEIVTSIRRVTDIMSEITAASVEQSQGIEQVNTAITQMDEVTQQNAALVEEAAAAAESLEEQAQNLAASVATFRVDNSEQVATRAPVARQALEHKAAPSTEHKAVVAHKPALERKAGAGKSTAVARPKPKSGEDGEWQEF